MILCLKLYGGKNKKKMGLILQKGILGYKDNTGKKLFEKRWEKSVRGKLFEDNFSRLNYFILILRIGFDQDSCSNPVGKDFQKLDVYLYLINKEIILLDKSIYKLSVSWKI